MKAKVIKVVYKSWVDGNRKENILYQDNKILDDPIEFYDYVYEHRLNKPDIILSVDFYIKLGDKVYERNNINLVCQDRKREIIKEEETVLKTKKITFLLDRQDFEYSLIQQIKKMEKEFYLRESELIEEAFNYIKSKYNYTFFRTQIEINGCIADGLAFVNSHEHYNSKIIGFEVKTNKDNYNRLYNQLNSYLAICDEVYLVIQDKDIPIDIPFYVGIIKIEDKAIIIREATSLKHSIDAHEFWTTLIKVTNSHIKISRDKDLINFFNVIENMKRKILWNQFVIGFSTKWRTDYVDFTDSEKDIIKSYFSSFP